jgi:flagellar assembly protein FliH
MQKELQTAYQRWELASFGDERPSVVARRTAQEEAVQKAQAMMPKPEELAAIRNAAQLEGYEAGRAQGYADGIAQGRAEAQADAERLAAVAATFTQAIGHADETLSNDVLELALHLARGMVKSAFEVRPELVIPVVREAIEYLPVVQQPAVLAVNPQDAPLVRAALHEELDKGGWRVIEDAQIARGGCKVDTASNQIDAQATTRWQRLTHALGKNLDWLAP